MKETPSTDYTNLVDLLAVFSEATHRLAALENTAHSALMEIVDENRAEYADLQSKLTQANTAIESITALHPDWFAKRRSVDTPYGTVKVTRTTKLEVKNEEATILRIEKAGKKEGFVRTSEVLDLEALEKLDDAELKSFGIVRVHDESVTIKAAKLNFGKAVKESEKAAVA